MDGGEQVVRVGKSKRRGVWGGWLVLGGVVAVWVGVSCVLWMATGGEAGGQELGGGGAFGSGVLAVSFDEGDVVGAESGDSYLRVVNEGTRSALEVAVRRFRPVDGDGPVIWLSGVVHLGEGAYYSRLQGHLDDVDRVLFEGVGRPGFAEPGAVSDGAKWSRSWDAVRFLGNAAERIKKASGSYPASLEGLRRAVAERQSMEAAWLRHAMNDAWGRQMVYELRGGVLEVGSLGADGERGGEGVDKDIYLTDQPGFDEGDLEDAEGLQLLLAEALGLRFQLNSIQYDRDNFVHSDLTLNELGRVMAGESMDDVLGGGDEGIRPGDDVEMVEVGAGNAELEMVRGMLDGSSMLGSVVKLVVGMVKMSPRLQGVVRLVMVETLGSLEGDISESPALPPAMRELMRSLIRDRNEVVMRDLSAAIGEEDGPDSISVFYGAGHMADLEKRVVAELGYEADGQVWLEAFGADASDTGMSAEQVEGLRGVIKVQMRMMSGE